MEKSDDHDKALARAWPLLDPDYTASAEAKVRVAFKIVDGAMEAWASEGDLVSQSVYDKDFAHVLRVAKEPGDRKRPIPLSIASAVKEANTQLLKELESYFSAKP